VARGVVGRAVGWYCAASLALAAPFAPHPVPQGLHLPWEAHGHGDHGHGEESGHKEEELH
jgi:hypothetical protein